MIDWQFIKNCVDYIKADIGTHFRTPDIEIYKNTKGEIVIRIKEELLHEQD